MGSIIQTWIAQASGSGNPGSTWPKNFSSDSPRSTKNNEFDPGNLQLTKMIQQVSKPAYLTEIQAASLVSELEEKNDLFNITLEGYSAWRIVRSKVLNKMQQYPFVDRRPSYLRIEWLFERLLLFVPDLISILSARPASFFVKSFSSALNDQVDGYYKDVY